MFELSLFILPHEGHYYLHMPQYDYGCIKKKSNTLMHFKMHKKKLMGDIFVTEATLRKA